MDWAARKRSGGARDSSWQEKLNERTDMVGAA